MNEISSSVSVCILMEILMSVQPFIHDSFCYALLCSAAFKYLVGMLESYGEDPFVKYSSADGIIRSPVEQLPPDFDHGR